METDPEPHLTKAIPPVSAETLKIAALFAQGKPGQVWTDESLSEHIGRDVTTECAHSVRSAVRRVLNEHNIVVHRVRKKGWKMAKPGEVIEGESSVPDGVYRKVKRSLRRLSSVDYKTLPELEKREHDKTATLLGVLGLVASNKGQATVAKKIEDSKAKLDPAKTLELFTSKK